MSTRGNVGTPTVNTRRGSSQDQSGQNLSSASPAVRYWCWECKAEVGIDHDAEGELHCSTCGCTFVEASQVPVDDQHSPEKFGETVTSASNTPASSPLLAPVEQPVAQPIQLADDRVSGSGVGSGSHPSSDGAAATARAVAVTTGVPNDISNSLQSTIENLFQMLFATRSALSGGDRMLGLATREATLDDGGGGANMNVFGDYAFGNLQDIIDSLSMNDPLAPRIGPAPPELIASLARTLVTRESVVKDDMPPCAICKDALVEDGQTEATAIRLGCSHMFHEECASMWLKQSSTCPVCRFHVKMVSSGETTESHVCPSATSTSSADAVTTSSTTVDASSAEPSTGPSVESAAATREPTLR